MSDKKRIYISGSISKNPKAAKVRFGEAEEKLKAAGYDVINPQKMDLILGENAQYEEYMRASMLLLSMCDGIYMIYGWQESKGARAELEYAIATGKYIMYGGTGEDIY
ncbi:MAG: DUF4406 domain-containing protein [Eubacteriales bacterium]|nr:DUF4406 domain-containing protein [Eubacteriales bacterium]